MTWRAGSILLALLAVSGFPGSAVGALCGDAVGGRDVPCACGDVVVSDVVLSDQDPVTRVACDGDGLTVRAASTTVPLTLDLNGATIRGSARGKGLWLLYGGPGGARVVSSGHPAVIEGFADGVVAHADDALGLLDNVVAQGSARDGFRIDGNGYEIRNAFAHRCGRDGFGVTGRNFSVSASQADGSRRYGFYVFGDGALLAGLTADGTGWGFGLWGMRVWLAASTATHALHDGFSLWGMWHTVGQCTASDNGGDGMTGMVMQSHLAGNQATDNARNGIAVNGPGVVDDGGNGGSGNRGEKLRRPVVQCAIAGSPCRP